jgi:L-lactate utilization protein LutC
VNRSAILAKLRGQARPETKLPPEFPSFPCYPDPVLQFRKELERVSGTFLDGRTPESLAVAFQRILEESGSQEIYWEGAALFARHGIECRLRNPDAVEGKRLTFSKHPAGQIELPVVLHSCPYSRQVMAGILVSVSSGICGIAETGTIVETARRGTGRLLAVLPPVHVCLLRDKDLLMNQAEFFSRVRPGEEGSYQVLVTGPSRTADIEKTLVLGVHGPQRHYVVLTG